MTDITIQIDAMTLKALEAAASQDHISVPKWIKKSILRELKQEWPENYFSLFGSLEDNDLIEPQEISFNYDFNRENL